MIWRVVVLNGLKTQAPIREFRCGLRGKSNVHCTKTHPRRGEMSKKYQRQRCIVVAHHSDRR